MNAAVDLAPISVHDLTRIFRQGDRDVVALRNISLSITRGEFVAIMGPSGSGKSTLLNLASGLDQPTDGSVIVDGQNIGRMSDSQLTRFRRDRIGLIFQAFNLIPTLTALDNVLLPAQASGKGDKDRAIALLNQLGLGARIHHKPDALSGGEQQRVAIARALINDPALIFADEPTGSLDTHSGQALCKLLRELCDTQNRTIVVVTHEAQVAIWAKRVIVLRDGELLSDFATSDLADANALALRYQAQMSAAPKE
jgi:putative ABC transport system ATP-binding protein